MNTLENDVVYVATYGSLRSLMGNHRVNGMADAVVVGLGHTKDVYDIYAYCSGFPSVSLTHRFNHKPVRVEVYATNLKGLTGPYDRLEGYPSFYNRTLVPIVMDDGREIEAWLYHIDKPTGPIVESGDWCLHKYGEHYYDDLENSRR